jgi:hypothetical protein
MAQTPPPTITAAPTAPQRSNRATFSGLVDAFVTWLIASVAQFQALAANVYANAQDAFASAGTALGYSNSASSFASTASGFADNAAASAVAAAAGSTAPAWVSGTTYAVGNVRYSPADFRTYRRITAGAGTADPSIDVANWLLISPGTLYIKVSDRKASGTAGGSSLVGTQLRTFNTVDSNNIPGASLGSYAANCVTIPAGTYNFRGRAPGSFSANRVILFNETGATDFAYGASANSTSGSDTDACISGRFTIASSTAFSLRHYFAVSSTTSGLGHLVNSGAVEIYSELEFWKVA